MNATDNAKIIKVPFRLFDVIEKTHKAGLETQTIAVICGTSEVVIETVLKFLRRKALRSKCLGSKEPA